MVDLGCGAGFDVFLAAKKVGERGKAIGIDMTKAREPPCFAIRRYRIAYCLSGYAETGKGQQGEVRSG